ncbi:hypothetical protein [Argonema antarcticum]|uniref:hypothetical protein n=1 Tax=Argonema antarcticum TaxID=2942763 RepID=UPI002011A9F2|nr:hypothetical protein [Argonema antarcticum]MCL1474702.1 hypothetical protein [Argonema antarcticum A004/B2]
MPKLLKNPDPIHPREFKQKHGMSLEELHEISQIPIDTLSYYLAKPTSARYVEPKPHICQHFGEIDERIFRQKKAN